GGVEGGEPALGTGLMDGPGGVGSDGARIDDEGTAVQQVERTGFEQDGADVRAVGKHGHQNVRTANGAGEVVGDLDALGARPLPRGGGACIPHDVPSGVPRIARHGGTHDPETDPCHSTHVETSVSLVVHRSTYKEDQCAL